jgi:hypothetical protein
VASVFDFRHVLSSLLHGINTQQNEQFGESHAGYRAHSVVYPTGNANENGTDGTKGNANRTIQRQADIGVSDSRRVKDRNVDSPKTNGTDEIRFNIKSRDANRVINSELAVKADTVSRIRMENSDHGQLRRIFHKGAG